MPEASAQEKTIVDEGGHHQETVVRGTQTTMVETMKGGGQSNGKSSEQDQQRGEDGVFEHGGASGDASGSGRRTSTSSVQTERRSPLDLPPAGTVRTNDGIDLKYERFGSHGGPVVVLIHGWSGSRHYWDLNVRPIARTCQVITYDQRFHGDSGKPNWGFHVARLASDLHDLLVGLGLQDVTVVGASMGASVIWSYYELFGTERLASCVFVDQAPLQNITEDWKAGSTGCYDIASLTRLQCRLLTDFKGFARDNAIFCSAPSVPDDVLNVLEHETLRSDPQGLAKLMADHTAIDWRPILPRIELPCLNIVARRSNVFPYWGCEEVTRLCPQSHCIYFEESNHWLYIDQPSRFSSIVAAFANYGFKEVQGILHV